MIRIFNIAVLLIAVLAVSCRVEAPVPMTPTTPIDDQWACRPDVIAAMTRAWIQSGNGYSGTEAGFRIDAERMSYIVVDHEFTNEQDKLTTQIVPWTIAEFHVHPNWGGAAPSTPENNAEGSEKFGDTKVADEHFIDIYTFNNQGLYVYRFTTKQTTLLRIRLEWAKPCVAVPLKKR
jgi:hypothetical protein